MSLRLEGPRRVKGGAAAAVVRQDIVPHASPGRLAIAARLAPVALVVRAGGVTRAFRPDGMEMPLEEVERLCPGTLAELSAAAEG